MKHPSVRFAFLTIATVCYAGIREAQVASDNPPAWFASIHPDLTGFRYPALARQARLAGTVRLKVSPGTPEITVESGHPLLAAAAQENLSRWKFNGQITEPILIEYVFRLAEPGCTFTLVPRADAFGRLLLRIFGRPTAREVVHCSEDVSPEVEGPMAATSGERRITVLVTAQPVQINPETTKVTD